MVSSSGVTSTRDQNLESSRDDCRVNKVLQTVLASSGKHTVGKFLQESKTIQ